MSRIRRSRLLPAAWRHLGVVLFNTYVTFIPLHALRLAVLRLWGAEIGHGVCLLRGTTVLGIEGLRIGDESAIGFRCLLDARGGLEIGNRVVIASDTQFIGGGHDLGDFSSYLLRMVVEDHVWIASRATVTGNLTIGRGAVVATCALVRQDVAPMAIVGGVPAIVLGQRESDLSYNPAWRPWGL